MMWPFKKNKKENLWKEGTQYFYECPCGHKWSYVNYDEDVGFPFNWIYKIREEKEVSTCIWCGRKPRRYGGLRARRVKDER
jgi:hypothetical protein